MKTVLVFLLVLFSSMYGCGQNFISNFDFENNGQPVCAGWYDYCGNELTYLCDSLVDTTTCNTSFFGAHLYADAPPAGGNWCMSMVVSNSALVAITKTTVHGQFKGVFEFKVWVRNDTTSSLSVYIEPKSGLNYTGQFGTGTMSTTWTQLIVRDTIEQLSDNVDIRFVHSIPGFWQGNVSYFDLPEFKMLDSWTDINSRSQSNTVSLFPNPFSDQLSCKLNDSEPATFSLYDLAGRLVLQHTFSNSVTLSTPQVESGLYFYEVRNNEEVIANGKLIRQ